MIHLHKTYFPKIDIYGMENFPKMERPHVFSRIVDRKLAGPGELHTFPGQLKLLGATD